jgi:hypothetical protein
MLLYNDLRQTKNSHLYSALKWAIKQKVNTKFERGTNAKPKNFDDMLVFIRSRGLKLEGNMSIKDLINFVKSIPFEK